MQNWVDLSARNGSEIHTLTILVLGLAYSTFEYWQQSRDLDSFRHPILTFNKMVCILMLHYPALGRHLGMNWLLFFMCCVMPLWCFSTLFNRRHIFDGIGCLSTWYVVTATCFVCHVDKRSMSDLSRILLEGASLVHIECFFKQYCSSSSKTGHYICNCNSQKEGVEVSCTFSTK